MFDHRGGKLGNGSLASASRFIKVNHQPITAFH